MNRRLDRRVRPYAPRRGMAERLAQRGKVHWFGQHVDPRSECGEVVGHRTADKDERDPDPEKMPGETFGSLSTKVKVEHSCVDGSAFQGGKRFGLVAHHMARVPVEELKLVGQTPADERLIVQD